MPEVREVSIWSRYSYLCSVAVCVSVCCSACCSVKPTIILGCVNLSDVAATRKLHAMDFSIWAKTTKRSAKILLDVTFSLTYRLACTTVLARRPPCPAGLAASGSPSGSVRRWWRGTFASRRAAPPSGPRAAPAWPKPEKSVAVCQSARRPLRSSAA